MTGERKPPERIWLLDFEGTEPATWCDDPAPSGEDHGAIEYVRADVVQSKLDRATEALEEIIPEAEDGCWSNVVDIARATLAAIKEQSNG